MGVEEDNTPKDDKQKKVAFADGGAQIEDTNMEDKSNTNNNNNDNSTITNNNAQNKNNNTNNNEKEQKNENKTDKTLTKPTIVPKHFILTNWPLFYTLPKSWLEQ